MLSGLVLHLLVLKSWKMANDTFEIIYIKLYLGGNWNGIKSTKLALFFKIQLLITGQKKKKTCLLFKINWLVIKNNSSELHYFC